MMEHFTHSLDLSNPFIETPKEIERFIINKRNWDAVVLYYFEKAEVLAVHYWPQDLHLTEDRQFSTKKYHSLLPYMIDDKPTDLDMHIASYSLAPPIKQILLESTTTGQSTDIFDFQLKNSSGVLVHSYDNGTSLFFEASIQMYEELSKLTSPGAIEIL
ncbi:hypothetical protein FIU87_02720 [Bacillus sp. THAF10]|uniref:hypothetical protein n=1 Tax=Bacillus sp. THAF10 TaxID=2587848 RepID=UPI001268B67A|nr:hypothetical protein [Bacillus sp. THAF10]QFT87554.1 hypothetical protein FIU87_02720 [Bacillus sp. THAF10]